MNTLGWHRGWMVERRGAYWIGTLADGNGKPLVISRHERGDLLAAIDDYEEPAATPYTLV